MTLFLSVGDGDLFILSPAGPDRLGNVNIGRIDHSCSHFQQLDLIGRFDLASIKKGLLAIDHLNAFRFQRAEHWQLHHVDAERLLFNAEVNEGLLRSEEHTSELQSLMRTSYAVFCL